MANFVTPGNIHRLSRTALLAIATFGVMGAAQAATDATTFNVRLTITESCVINTTAPTNVVFANQARTAAALTLDATGIVNVNCTPGTAYTVGLSGGINTVAPATQLVPTAGVRRMRLGATTNYVGYELYTTAARTVFWGNTTGSWLAGTGTGANVAMNVFGRVTGANAPAGLYEDTVTATVTY